MIIRGSGYQFVSGGQQVLRPWSGRIAVLVVCVLLVSAPAQEKRLAIYAPQTNYTVAVAERNGKEYAGLVDVLEPLGKVTAQADGNKWRLRFVPGGGKEIEAQFTAGSNRAKIRGTNVELAAPLLLENGRGLAPLHSLGTALTAFFNTGVDFHEAGRRLFVGGTAVHYAAELKKLPVRLILTFSAPVNPFVATEPGKLRMVFTREPVIASGAASQPLDDRTITGLAFNESNGAAELTVSANAPLLASFSDGGKMITITAAPQPAQAQPPSFPATPPAPPPAPATPAPPKFLVAIDPGHGGSDSGAALGDIAEKDFNLALARRLRTELENREISAVLLRDADNALPLEQRALLANGDHAAVFVSLHAAANGAGARVYTSDLPAVGRKPGSFLPWETVQSAYLELSTVLATGIADELGKRQVPVLTRAAPVSPLNHVAAVAVAIEVAPPANDAQGLTSPVYQQSICNAIAGALAMVRARVEAAR